MLKKILVAVDGSPESVGAARLAMTIASKFGSEVNLLHVFRPLQDDYSKTDLAGFQLPSQAEVDAEQWRSYGKQIVDKVSEEVKLPDITMVLEVGYGNPAAVIVQNAEQGHFDLIVIGNRGLGGIKESILGSVSNKVSHLAKCPVLIYK